MPSAPSSISLEHASTNDGANDLKELKFTLGRKLATEYTRMEIKTELFDRLPAASLVHRFINTTEFDEKASMKHVRVKQVKVFRSDLEASTDNADILRWLCRLERRTNEGEYRTSRIWVPMDNIIDGTTYLSATRFEWADDDNLSELGVDLAEKTIPGIGRIWYDASQTVDE